MTQGHPQLYRCGEGSAAGNLIACSHNVDAWNLLAKQSVSAAQVKIETERWSRLKRNKFTKFASSCMLPWMN